MLGNYFKKKLGIGKDKEVPSTEQFYTPLRIALHSTITLNTIDMVVVQSALHPSFVVPNGPLEVLAIGKTTMDDMPIHQVYLKDLSDEQFILQIVEGKDWRSQKPTVDEVTLFKQVVTIEPETEASLDRCLGDIGFPEIELDDVAFERVWGDAYTEKANFRNLNEVVVTPGGNEKFTNQWLLYGREIENPVGGDPIVEYLLVGIEEGDNNAQVMMQLGLRINESDVTVQ